VRAEKRPTDVRKGEIVRAALALISSGGLKALSVAAIARDCGLAPSAVYRHFKGKEEIIDGVLDLIGSMLAENLDRALEGGIPTDEALSRLFDRHILMITKNGGIPRLVFSDEIYGRRPDRKRRMYRVIQGYLAGIEELVRRAQEDGAMSAAHPPEAWSYLFLGLLQPAAILWHLSEGRADVARLSQSAWQVYQECAFKSPPKGNA
jgi:AcrR family transcriptional regulator